MIGMLRKLASIVFQTHTIQKCNQDMYILNTFVVSDIKYKLANYQVNVFNTFKISEIFDFCEIINPEISIHRDHLIETSFRVYFL